MSCFTLLRLFNVYKWILIFILFFGDWHMLCQRLKCCTPNICLQRIWVYYFYHVHFPCVCLGLGCFVFCRCLLIFYLFISYLFLGFWFFLQQSICIAFISCVVKFALSYFLLLSSCCLLVRFPHCCLDFRLFCFSKHFFATIYLFIEHRY